MHVQRATLILFAYFAGLGIAGGVASAETIALIGTGDVGAAIGVRFTDAGDR